MTKQNDETKFFVSRRGKQVGVHQVDLTGIDIDSNDAESTKPKTARAKEKPVKTKTDSPDQRLSSGPKKKAIIFAVILLVIALPIVFAELVTSQYKNGTTSAKNDLQKLVASTVLPAQKNATISADNIGEIRRKANDVVGHMCRGGLLDNAAGLYPRAKAALDDCRASQQRYSALVDSLSALEIQARYLEQIDTIMKPVATPITEAYAVIGAQQTAWQSASGELQKLSAPTSMKSPQAELTKHVSAVAQAWSDLNTANNAQDAAAFNTAEQTLNDEYEAIRGTSSSFRQVLSGTQTKLTASYRALK